VVENYGSLDITSQSRRSSSHTRMDSLATEPNSFSNYDDDT